MIPKELELAVLGSILPPKSNEEAWISNQAPVRPLPAPAKVDAAVAKAVAKLPRRHGLLNCRTDGERRVLATRIARQISLHSELLFTLLKMCEEADDLLGRPEHVEGCKTKSLDGGVDTDCPRCIVEWLGKKVRKLLP